MDERPPAGLHRPAAGTFLRREDRADLVAAARRELRWTGRTEARVLWRGRWWQARETAFRVLVDDERGRPVACRWG